MARAKKPNEVKYGIEITKPHSQEMYDHNDMVSAEMKANILDKWNRLIKGIDKNMPWEYIKDEDTIAPANGKAIIELQKLVCFSGYGTGYTVGDVDEEFRRELDMMQNYSIHQEYSYGVFSRLLPRTKFMMLGHSNEKFDYHMKGSNALTSPACYESIPCSKELDEEMHRESEGGVWSEFAEEGLVDKIVDRLTEDSIDK